MTSSSWGLTAIAARNRLLTARLPRPSEQEYELFGCEVLLATKPLAARIREEAMNIPATKALFRPFLYLMAA
jgi:hypothetical protein